MANCTYTIRRPGNVAWAEGISALADAAAERDRANQITPGHQIFADWGSAVTEVDEDDVADAVAERETQEAHEGL